MIKPPEPQGLKQRVMRGETLTVPLCGIDPTDDALAAALQGADACFLDGQHGCFAEERVPAFCARAAAHGVPVLYRIRHPELAFLTGVALDHGPAGVIVPQVERADTVRAAVDAFYYPPLGSRGWGPRHAYGRADRKWPDAQEYADWWNANGVLAIQLESAGGVRNARLLAEAGLERGYGVDMVMFGPMDLGFSLRAEAADRAVGGRTAPEPELADLEACYDFVRRELADLPVKVTVGGNPFGVV